MRDEPQGGRCRHDTGQAPALAVRFVALASDDAPVCLNLDLKYLAVLGTGLWLEAPPALGATRLHLDGLHDRWQVTLAGAAMTWRAALLAPAAIGRADLLCRLVRDARALGLAAEVALAQITNPGLGQFKFAAQPKLDLARALEGVTMTLLGLTHLNV